uniref:Protein rogdi n=1 Tax=Elaeophora elaphi TaxID=1147741 RepID=A0A0R3RHX6_9BILA
MMSEVDVATKSVHRLSDQNDNDDDDDGINRSSPESKEERALQIQRVLLAEQDWFQNLEVIETFTKLENILREICKRMNLSAKVDSSVKLEAENPTAEKFSLVQRTGAEVLKCLVTLLGESIIQTEVVIKYPKMPGGIYRGTAQPDVQWKLQQMQDADNYYIQALSMLVHGLKWIKEIPADDIGKISSIVITTVAKITSLIGHARSTLYMPEKRTLLELCNSPITRCFSPPLPPDLVFSYYISANRLVCAAYQVTPKTTGSGSQGLIVTLAECLLPQLVDVLVSTDRALNVAQQFSYNMCMLRERINTYSHICS